MKKILLVILLIFTFSLIAQQAYARLVPCGPGMPSPDDVCQFCHFFVLFKNIIDFILYSIIPPVAVFLVAWGGILFFFSAENPANIEKAKSLFKSVAIGLIIIYSSWFIVNLFFQAIGVQDWTGLREGWWKIDCP